MGAGASTISGDSNAQLAAELAVNASLPVSKITAEVKEFAVRLKTALSTEDGWKELQQLFKSLRPSLDEEVSSSEWGSMVYQDEGLRVKYFGDLSPEEIAAHFNGLDEDGKTRLTWEEFVDGAVSLSAAVLLSDELATAEGEMTLKELFDTIGTDEDGRVWLGDWSAALIARPDLLARFTGLDSEASMRFKAFFMTGRFQIWMSKTFRRLGLSEDDDVTWDEFRAGGRATGAS